jgi:PncC family amidohydrolase
MDPEVKAEDSDPRLRAREDSIAAKSVELGERLRARGLTLAVAESCTGGAMADAITDIAGSSDYFLGGVVSYSNDAKRLLLGVEQGTLDKHGAVSAQAARQMAEGARRALGAGLGAGITGVAGPGGGTPEKPVGLVYICVATSEGADVQRYRWTEDRRGNKLLSVEAALMALLSHLSG